MHVNAITYWFFGITNDSEKRLLKEIIRTTDRIYLKWAIDKLLRWRNTNKPVSTIKIHGDVDKILPAKQADYIINGGGHFMMVTKASEISDILNKIFS
jgi:hypothetical protein